MNSQESSLQPASCWAGHFKVVLVGDIKAIFDAHGKLFYDPQSHRLQLFDNDDQLRLAVPMHRVRQPRSDRFPKGNQYCIILTQQTKAGVDRDCELQFKCADEASRLNLHKFILAERGIEHPGALRKKYPLGNAMPAERAPAAKVPKVEPPRASTPTYDEGLVEQLRQKDADLEGEKAARKQAEEEISRLKQENEKLRQKDADLEAEKAARKQAEEEISRLKQENAKKDQAIVDLTMELLELKRSK